MDKQTVRYGDVVIHIYKNYKDEQEVNIANDCENITLSIPQTRHLLFAFLLLGMKSELLDDGEGVA